jgi:hypothetical protein
MSKKKRVVKEEDSLEQNKPLIVIDYTPMTLTEIWKATPGKLITLKVDLKALLGDKFNIVKTGEGFTLQKGDGEIWSLKWGGKLQRDGAILSYCYKNGTSLIL